MSLNLTTYDSLLKRLYPTERVWELVYQRYPLLNLFEKARQASGGQALVVPLIYSGTNNRSADISVALAADSAIASAAFLITTSSNFNTAKVDHKTILSSQTDKMAFGRSLDRAIKGAMDALMRDIGGTMFRDGTGAFGVISSISKSGTSGTITFTSRQACRFLEPGCVMSASASADLSSPDTYFLTVTKVDRQNGIVTYSATSDAGAAWAAASYVFLKGDANAKFKGLGSWLPSGTGRTAALAASFFGVTRDVDPVRLGGLAFDASASSIEGALIEAESRLSEEGGMADVVVMAPSDVVKLKEAVGSRYIAGNLPGANAKISYPSMVLASSQNAIEIIPDPFCPAGTAYMLQTETWRIAHLGKDLVNTWNEDGLGALRANDSNDLIIRMYSYMQPYCEAPGFNCVITGLT